MTEGGEFRALDDALDRSIAPWAQGPTPVTLLFSGGVDSGLLAWELRQNPHLTLTTVGLRGSADLRNAEESAGLLGRPWFPTEVTPAEIAATANRSQAETADLPPTARTVLIAFSVALERAPGPTVLCGQGVDELFLGYAHFRGLEADEAARRSEKDLDQLVRRDWPLAQQIARRLGKIAIAPYLAPAFVAAAKTAPIALRLPRGTPKEYFRRWAARRGLPPTIANRPKRALQFGSGIDRWIPPPPGRRDAPERRA